MNQNKSILLNLIKENPLLSSKEIHQAISMDISYASVKRNLQNLQSLGLVSTEGAGKSTKYKLSEDYHLLNEINVDEYFEKEIDERKIITRFNFDLLSNTLIGATIFTNDELELLNQLQKKYLNNIYKLNQNAFISELERLAIDLSWKSSQIEGNTYSLLETELLLKEKITASGKTKDEAIMLLNHKAAIDFIVEHKDFASNLTKLKLESLHSLLVNDLVIEKKIRKHKVGISGTNFLPLDNDFQIIEAIELAFKLINNEQNIFAKTLLCLVLISYIQPFEDGNKRTARILSNAILINHNYCPISFRTVDSIEYKKAMLIFYEQNNISAFKKIFINQFEFAVNTYF